MGPIQIDINISKLSRNSPIVYLSFGRDTDSSGSQLVSAGNFCFSAISLVFEVFYNVFLGLVLGNPEEAASLASKNHSDLVVFSHWRY